MSIRQGSDWSGLVTASTLPHEVTERMMLNVRCLQAAMRTPTPNVQESYRGRPAGTPAVVESYVGGAAGVRVGTLSNLRYPQASKPWGTMDNWDRNHLAQTHFHEFFSRYVRGGIPIRESLPAYNRPIGPVSYGGRNRQKNRPVGVPDWYKPLPGEARDTDDWIGDEEEETKVHDGSCQWAHPGQSHGAWSASEEEEERHRLKSRIGEKYLRLLVTESHEPNLRRWAIRKLRS